MKYVCVLLLSCVCASLHAAPVTAPPATSKVSVRANSLPDMLSRAVLEQRVIAVGEGNRDATYPEETVRKAAKLLTKLQAVSDAASTDEDALIPYLVRKTWIIAPESREEVNLDAAISALDVAAREAVLEIWLNSLTRAQLQRLGSAQGLPVSQFSPTVKDLVGRLLAPPLNITNHGREVGRISEPLDLSKVRIRAGLTLDRAHVDTGEPGRVDIERFDLPQPDSITPYIDGGDMFPGSMPFVASVANTFKPSDLDGKRYPQPFGATGVMRVSEALKRVEAATGLHLAADFPYKDQPVFVGSASVPCGDVLDALRLGLTAAFRRLGGTYILAWDRRGLAAVQRLAAEKRYSAAKEAARLQKQAESSAFWLHLGEDMPFTEDSPFKLTEEQRNALLQPSDWTAGNPPRIPFAQMTPEQQQTIHDMVRAKLPSNIHLSGRSATEEDVPKSYLGLELDPQISVQVPGHGWVAPGSRRYARPAVDGGTSATTYRGPLRHG